MKKLKAYKIIVELSDNYVNKFYGVGRTKNEVKENWKDNGEYALVEDVTNDYRIYIDDIHQALFQYGFGDTEMQIIEDVLRRGYDNTWG